MKKYVYALSIPIIAGIVVVLVDKFLTSCNLIGGIWNVLKWFFSLFVIKVTLPVWAIIIFLIVLYLLFATIRRAHSVANQQTNTEPDWKNYCEDHFFDIDWTWGYIINSIDRDSIKSYCPKCQRKLEVQSDHSFNPYAIVSCYHCEFKKGFDIDLRTLIDRVEQEIKRKIRTGEYKKPDISNQA